MYITYSMNIDIIEMNIMSIIFILSLVGRVSVDSWVMSGYGKPNPTNKI